MKRYIVLVTALLAILILSGTAGADLLDRGDGLIYDDILGITWLGQANYSGETLSWDEAVSWANDLVFQGYDDWRLPLSDTSCIGNDCIGSEMGSLFYNYNITSGTPGLFDDVRPYMYWSETVYGPDTSMAWRFHFGTGYQGTSSKTYNRYAWAVRDGDSIPPVVPEPASAALIISGGILMAAGRLRKQ